MGKIKFKEMIRNKPLTEFCKNNEPCPDCGCQVECQELTKNQAVKVCPECGWKNYG